MIDIRDLYEKDYIGKEITISGWIRNHRKQAHFGFIDLSDGTYFKNLQVVYDDKLKKFDEITKLKARLVQHLHKWFRSDSVPGYVPHSSVRRSYR